MYFSIFFLFQCFFFSSLSCAPIPIFEPPANWECAFPENQSPCIQVGYIGKGSTTFRPSINLAIEEVNVDLKKYIKAVKAIHLAEKGTTWRDLGKFKTRLGEGRLTEIGANSPLGPLKMLQMIAVSDGRAYILTGAAIKEDFLHFQEEFLKAFQSLKLAPDLFDPLPPDKKERFQTFFSQIGESPADEADREAKWADVQKMVIQETKEMGNYWQFLVLKEAREKIYR